MLTDRVRFDPDPVIRIPLAGDCGKGLFSGKTKSAGSIVVIPITPDDVHNPLGVFRTEFFAPLQTLVPLNRVP